MAFVELVENELAICGMFLCTYILCVLQLAHNKCWRQCEGGAKAKWKIHVKLPYKFDETIRHQFYRGPKHYSQFRRWLGLRWKKLRTNGQSKTRQTINEADKDGQLYLRHQWCPIRCHRTVCINTDTQTPMHSPILGCSINGRTKCQPVQHFR